MPYDDLYMSLGASDYATFIIPDATSFSLSPLASLRRFSPLSAEGFQRAHFCRLFLTTGSLNTLSLYRAFDACTASHIAA